MNDREWREDIEQLQRELPRVHKNFFYVGREDEFYTRIERLKQELKDMDTYEIVMELARVVGTARDAHTAVMLPQNYRLPLECYPFAEGLYITATDAQHRDLLHSKVLKLGDSSIDSVYERLAELIPHENMQFVLSSLPNMITCADVLYGLGIITAHDDVAVTVEDRQGKVHTRVLKSLLYDDYLPVDNGDDSLPLYRKNKDKYYWSSFAEGILYVNYKRCKNMDDLSVGDFCEGLKTRITNTPTIEKLVLDLRNNTGGNSELMRPFLSWLSQNEEINVRGKLFVIVGRDTFSSASLNVYYLKSRTNAIFVGEPTGGKPNHYGEVKYLELTNSGLYIRYSTKYYELIDDDEQQSFVPCILCEVSFEDYINGIDRCMESLSMYNKRG